MDLIKQNIQVAGFKHDVKDFSDLVNKINEIDANCTIQLLNSDGIAGKEHIIHATTHALNAFDRCENISNDLGLEICVRTSAQRQISKALDILGLKNGAMSICAVFVGCKTSSLSKLEVLLDKRDDSVLKPDVTALKNIYGISDDEIETAGSIENVMIERTAILILET